MELLAPSHWKSVDFISDLHLHPADPLTAACWRDYLKSTAADAVFILGDLFEVWVGDDILLETNAFESHCAATLSQAATRTSIYLMHGNRDFLMGQGLAAAARCTLLPDPTVLAFAGMRWVLSHGDYLCLDDTAYMAFRAMVRGAAWQSDFLSQPLAQRQAVARQIRAQSESKKQADACFVDADFATVQRLLEQSNASTLVHGHTHRPATHAVGQTGQRIVLSDWDLTATPKRCEVLRVSFDGASTPVRIERLTPDQCAAHS